MPNSPFNRLIPPKTLSEFLMIYDDDVCDHADDAGVVIKGLVSGDGYQVSHDRDMSLDTDTMELVIEVQLEFRVSNPDMKKVR